LGPKAYLKLNFLPVDCRPARRFNDPKKRVLPEEETALKRPEIAEPEVGRQTGGQADHRVRGGINEDEKKGKTSPIGA
jgi:hypothetical protein